ncbi:MAG: hypothetical protein ACOZB3_11730 [Calditrichota bacterium]
MRIESYNLNPFPTTLNGVRPTTPTPGGTPKPAAETTELSAQDKLRMLLEEKRTLALQFESDPSGQTLGKNIDLRV